MHTLPLNADVVRGAIELEPTARGGVLPQRLPAWARTQAHDPQLTMSASQPSGVRVVVRTRATVLELDTVPTKREHAGAPPRPDGVYELVVDGEVVDRQSGQGGNVLAVDLATGTFEHRPGEPVTLRFEGLPAGEKDLEVWLPHDETTELLAVRADEPLAAVPNQGRVVWLHHGSSISQGSNAATPTGTWPAVAARAAGVDLVNLGFGGSALVDPFTARTMRDTPADVVSVKLGINVVNTDLMRLRAFGPAVHGFLDTIREGHPAAPLLVVSPLLCPIHERTPGPAEMDPASLATGSLRYRAAGDPADVATGRLTLEVIRDELARIVAERSPYDEHLHLLDGRVLYGEADHAELPLRDDLHPDAATHVRIGERFAALGLVPLLGRSG